MRDRRSMAAMAAMTDSDLELALRDLGSAIAWPQRAADASAPDPARRARLTIQESGAAAPARPRLVAWPGQRLGLPAPRPLRRAVVLALVAILVVAALAAALGIGVPGIRIAPAQPTSPPPSGDSSSSPSRPTPAPTPIAVGFGLGDEIPVDSAARAVDFPLLLPPGPLGPPASAWLLEDGRLSLVWPPGPQLPTTTTPGLGMVLTQFRGSIDSGYFQKVLDQGTVVTAVKVGEADGYWISGRPHEIILVNPSGDPVFDSRRSAGDTLIWSVGDLTYRLESGLKLDAAISLATSLR